MNHNDKLDKVSIVINVLATYLGIEIKEMNDKLKKKENKYLLLLLLRDYRCLQKDRVKEILNIISDKSIKYNIDKAEEKFLINKEFREMYFEIQEGINKII
ncbi:hypothetical protein R0131_01490 [Clostridium sp. AL.422]|uniref:hypothetical protein n=1 Tax=Clostridium TaxID=1485 RepID=UPI00293DD90E|nr:MULTISPECIES: hypothetical protein [unclassified Clostridium]MDV4149501.1 hypothetical protein [Clostridium sp. AL.422]